MPVKFIVSQALHNCIASLRLHPLQACRGGFALAEALIDALIDALACIVVIVVDTRQTFVEIRLTLIGRVAALRHERPLPVRIAVRVDELCTEFRLPVLVVDQKLHDAWSRLILLLYNQHTKLC